MITKKSLHVNKNSQKKQKPLDKFCFETYNSLTNNKKGGEEMDEKVKAFVAHIMDECEQEGFTLAYVTAITVQFDATVSSRICDIKAETKFTSG